MRLRSESLVRNLARAAVLGMALAPAVVYLFVGYSAVKQLVSDDAKVQAITASAVVSSRPDTWRSGGERMAEQIERVRHRTTRTVVIDTNGTVLLEIGPECPRMCLSYREPLLNFDTAVGEVMVKADLEPIIARALTLGSIALAIGVVLLTLLNRHVLVPLEQMKAANVELAFYDPLTKLPNRRLMIDRLEQALIASHRRQEYGAVMILDLDKFKVLNDTQGHDAGDRLLIEVGQRIRAYVRQEDTVSRLGGDEFVVLVEALGKIETTAAERAESIAEKIRNALAQPYYFSSDQKAYHHTVSIGLNLFQGQNVSIDSLLKQADVALYQAKDAGRNAIRFFNSDMQKAIDTRAAMESALRNGLRFNEFQLCYQPQVGPDRRLVGAEALLRWQPANRPAVSPGQFIPLAEDSGLIVEIGQWVLQTACAQLQAWKGGPLGSLVLSINVSALQFRQPDFVEHVRDALVQWDVNPGLLCIELTESMIVEKVEQVIERMREIKALGVKFSLDDFGTGYSSLSYLKRFPLDEIKIDQSFVRDITADPNDAAIVRAIIAMSDSLGFDVIAEGVETDAQRDFLIASGCQRHQGYLFGKPMKIEDFENWSRSTG